MVARRELPFSPWWLVVAGAVAMGSAGFYQFVWSSVRVPLGAQLGIPEAALGTVFTVFVACQTLSQVPAGWVRDRYGPRVPLLVGAVFLAAGFGLTAGASSLWLVYLAYALGGIGAGATYNVAVNTPVKWFDSHRGLATGLVSMTYGAVSVVAIPAVRSGVATDFETTLLVLAGLAGAGALVAVPVLRDPPDRSDRAEGADTSSPDGETAGSDDTAGRDHTWREAVATWQFALLYLVFVLTNAVSLMVVGKAVSLAGQFGLSAWVATASASVIALADATGILAGGALSDRIGARRTIAWALVCSGVSLGLAVVAGRAGLGVGFIALVGAAIFFRGPLFSAVPPLLGDYFGPSDASTNFALLYTGKLWGGVGAGVVASGLVTVVGWTTTFLAGAVLVCVAGALTLLLRPVEGPA